MKFMNINEINNPLINKNTPKDYLNELLEFYSEFCKKANPMCYDYFMKNVSDLWKLLNSGKNQN